MKIPWEVILVLIGFALVTVTIVRTVVFSDRRERKAERIRDIDAYIAEIKQDEDKK